MQIQKFDEVDHYEAKYSVSSLNNFSFKLRISLTMTQSDRTETYTNVCMYVAFKE